jgi:hypothetical protein
MSGDTRLISDPSVLLFLRWSLDGSPLCPKNRSKSEEYEYPTFQVLHAFHHSMIYLSASISRVGDPYLNGSRL